MLARILISLIVVSISISCSRKKKEEAPETPVAEKKAEDHAPTKHKAHWSYEGAMGPQFWGDLDAKFKACKEGQNQSPVDLIWKRPKASRDIEFKYGESLAEVIDNGHTIQVNMAPGNMVNISGNIYELLQFHVHSPSEHTISGKNYDMEIHFVHKDQMGNLAVVGVMVSEGAKSDLGDVILSNIPKEKHTAKPVSQGPINPNALLPHKMHYYHYMGSLTTPPCSEGVNWNVFNTPITFSKGQIAVFRSHYLGNNRPVQSLNQRETINY